MSGQAAPTQRPLVDVFGPGAETKGGITTFAQLVGETAHGGVELRFVLTHADSPWLHVRHFARAVATAIFTRKRPGLLFHINIASYGSTFRKYIIGSIARLRGIPYVLNVHCGAYERFFGGLRPLLRRRVQALFRSARMVVVIAKRDQRLFTEVIGVDPARVILIPNGAPGPLDLPARPPAAKVGFVYAGLIAPPKGTFDFLRALELIKDLPGWRAIVAGDGEMTEARQAASIAGLADRVEFPGWVEQDAVRRLLREGGVFVLPSYSEGLPFALLEAMAEGCAVITTPVGAIVDVIEPGVDGLLVEPGDVEALAEAMRGLVEDRDRMSRLGSAAHRKWKSQYSDSVMVERMTEVWRQTAL